MRKPAGWAVLGGVLAAAILACGDRNVYAPPPPPRVVAAQPSRQPVVDYLTFTGNTQAIKTVQLKARVQGFLEKILFKDGDLVKKGQLLFLIQQNTYQDQLQQAEAQVLQQKANYDHAVIETARYTRLVQQKAAAQLDLDNWKFQRDAFRAGMLAAQAAQKLAQLNLDYTQVTAPFDGRIGRHLVDVGNLVGAGEFTLLATVNQIDPLYVYFTMNERDLLRVTGLTGLSPAQAQQLNIPLSLGLANETEYPHKGRFDFASISLTPTTGTLLLRGIFPNPDGKILPGAFARVRVPIVGTEKTALVVPEVALAYDQLGPYVLLVNENNVVQHRSVKLGVRVDSSRVIQAGLTGDEWVIIQGQIRAFPGKKVTPIRKPGPEEATKTSPQPAGNQPGKAIP
ncbi:MAG: efflux RND transporter periplasmic adaptor subunit [Syntrophobacterales bacterium]|jgi:RND family efflux transporter MFP subunit|nr:efflux RND transporter periplasmic adaptor subunit [Syntrophobacterales bacterium]